MQPYQPNKTSNFGISTDQGNTSSAMQKDNVPAGEVATQIGRLFDQVSNLEMVIAAHYERIGSVLMPIPSETDCEKVGEPICTQLGMQIAEIKTRLNRCTSALNNMTQRVQL